MKRNVLVRWVLGVTAVSFSSMLGCAHQSPDSSVAQGPQTVTRSPASSAGAMMGGGMAGDAGIESAAKRVSNSPAPAESTGEEGSRAIQLANFQQSQPDRYLIKNASITIEVKEAKDAAARLTQAMQATRGYLSDMQESVDALGVRSITMTVRVPSKGFDKAMSDIGALGKVLDRQVGAEDVTEEFVDSQSRLRNLKRTEERLLAHLARTGKLSDTLLVEREMTRVRQEIEQLEGRLRFLANRIAYSTIAVTLRETPKATSPVPTDSFSSGQVASEASRSLVGFAQSIWSLAIWLAVWSPVWILMLVVTVVGYRKLKPALSSTQRPAAPA